MQLHPDLVQIIRSFVMPHRTPAKTLTLVALQCFPIPIANMVKRLSRLCARRLQRAMCLGVQFPQGDDGSRIIAASYRLNNDYGLNVTDLYNDETLPSKPIFDMVKCWKRRVSPAAVKLYQRHFIDWGAKRGITYNTIERHHGIVMAAIDRARSDKTALRPDFFGQT